MMKHLIDLEYVLKKYGEDHLIDAIHRHACEIGANEVVSMIKTYWRDKNKLSQKDYNDAQEKTIGE
jgi:hypothetical protein